MKPSANPKRTLIESLQVGLAWDSQIKDWAERELPNGEVVGRVKNAQTVNYKTLKPVKDGLFCEKIFGPTKDFECACGFKQTRGGFCPQCNVEFTRSEVRRYRLGYFQLPSAVTHVWYLRGRPSYISYLLGIKIKKALALTYGAASLLVNTQNEKVISQKEDDIFIFSFTTQTLYNIGECKGKTVPRGQIRRYNSNHYLFDTKRAKFLRKLFHNFIYSSRGKILPSTFEDFAKQNLQKQDKQNMDFPKKSTLPFSGGILETNLQYFSKEKKDSVFSYSQTENLNTSLLSKKLDDLSTNSCSAKPFFFSSTIRGGWQPLIVVNLQDKLPVQLSSKKTHFKYYRFKKYLKFLQNRGFYTSSIFAKKKKVFEKSDFSQSENQSHACCEKKCKEDSYLHGFTKGDFLRKHGIQDILRQEEHDILKTSFFTDQDQTENLPLVRISWWDKRFDIRNGNGLLNNRRSDKDTISIDTDHDIHFALQNGRELYFSLNSKRKTKSFFDKFILLNKQKKMKKSLVGINKKKELSLPTLIFYPLKKEINKTQENEILIKNYPELNKEFYQELNLKLKSLNSVENSNKQIGFSSLPEKKVNLEHKFAETESIFEHFVEQNVKDVNLSGKNQSQHMIDISTQMNGSHLSQDLPQDVLNSHKSTYFTKQNLLPSKEKLTDFKSLFHFIGQPCQLKKKSRFLVYTASSFSQTRNQIFKILEKEKSINSIDFGNKLSYYDKELKEKYKILSNNIRKEYHQNHLFPYLFCLSCQSKNYQYLQTYSNFFIPILSNSEKTLFISSYKNQTIKNQFLNLYESFLKKELTKITPFSCFDNSLTIGLKHFTNFLAMRPLIDYFAEKNQLEISENFTEENRSQKKGDNKFNEENESKSTGKTFGLHFAKQNVQDKSESKNIVELQNLSLLKNTNLGHHQIANILGEIPLVLDFCEHVTGCKKKNSQFFHQKKRVLQNKASIFWKLQNKDKLLQYKSLKKSDKINPNLQSQFNESKMGSINFLDTKISGFASHLPHGSHLVEQDVPNFGTNLGRRKTNQKKNLSGFFSKTKTKENRIKKRKDFLFQNLKLQKKSLPKALLKLNKDSPLFLQDININSFFNASKNQKLFRGFLIKNLFVVENKLPFFKNTPDRSSAFGPFDEVKALTGAEKKQKLKERNQHILSFWEEKPNFLCFFPSEKNTKNYANFQKVDLFKNFAEQNFPPNWKRKQQIKTIFKKGNILKNFKRIKLSPISSKKWSYLSKKLNKEDYLFSIYEISVQQALTYTCGEAILKILSPINCCQLESGLKVVLWQINERISEVENQGFLLKSDIILLNSLRTKKSRTLRRLKIAKILRKTKVLPKQMVFSLLPVLPPSLRPIIQLDENIVAVSDCSQIYQKIVQRSNRLSKRMSKYLSYDHCLRLKVLLQQAVDGLIENGKGGSKPLCDNNGRPLKSLSDGLKGKKGRFRQDLLGRRVDYSGRSVIVVGPALKLHQCGLPREMAIELFQPFLIRQLFAKKIVSNIAVAKNYIKKEAPIVLEILKQLLRSHPVLLNRAPTLHRLGVQAFQPKLVSGRAILLHPLVCSAFNADFDGDQMAVHIPLSSKARGEAWKILWSRNNILSPATGQPILVPSQDMVLGCYYLTTKKAKKAHKWTGRLAPITNYAQQEGLFFNNSDQIIKDLQQKRLKLHTSIWLKMDRNIEIHKEEQRPLEARINCCGTFTKIYPGYLRRFYKKEGLFLSENKIKKQEDFYVRTTCGRVMLNQTISPILHQSF